MVDIKGGEDLDKYLQALATKLGAGSGGASVDVGFLEGATYPDGTSVPLVAALNEFGTGHSPPRPFFRQAVENRAAAWGHNTGVALKQTDYNAGAALALVGQGVKEDVQDSIRTLTTPPLAESTIARKTKKKAKKVRGVLGPAKPLVDTGHMLNSVGVRLRTGDQK